MFLNVDPMILEFLKTRKSHLFVDLNKVKPGQVFPTPASWARFDEVLKDSSSFAIDSFGFIGDSLKFGEVL